MFKSSICKNPRIPNFALLLLLILWISDSKGQSLWQHKWQGKLEVAPGMNLTLILHVDEKDGELTASLDSPDQGALGIPASKVSTANQQINIDFAIIGANYIASLNKQQLIGSFTQGGRPLPLTLTQLSPTQVAELAKATQRPQEPQAPYPYIEELVTYPHPDGTFQFAGTLTKPQGKGPFAAAILISGSGPQDRDESMVGHKPFKLLADYLSRKGYAVLRTDDRGTGDSGGDFSGSTIQDFSTDVQAAFDYLQSRADINNDKIGLIGHSEGGVTGPLFAAQQPKVAFVIMLAGLGVPGHQLWATQQRDIGLASGMQDGEMIYQLHLKAAELSAQKADFAQIKALFTEVPDANEQMINMVSTMLSSDWGHSLTAYDPKPVLSQLKMPLLAINGDLDLQVSGKDNLAGIKQIMATTANKDVTVLLLPQLNHLMQQATTGHPSEYGQINETINPVVLEHIGNWLQARL